MASEPADLGVHVGQVLLGKYRIDAILGRGGMGVVVECMHLGLHERRAVKMLRADVLGDHDAVQRFMREAQAAVKLKSEYVAKVHDVGLLEDGVPYMEMEFLEGLDLGQLLEERGTLQAPWAIEVIVQTCEALAEAHSLGIVHRDIKPSNLFVTWRPDGSSMIKVLDFGISKAPVGTDMQLTQTQSLLGTPAYMSPEQMRSARAVDARTDIWSLGTVLYEVLEGKRPFEADSFSEMCVKVAVDPPAPMTVIPPEIQPVVLRCLEKSPDQRYPSMAELARDLVPFARDPHQAAVLVERMGRVLRRSLEMPARAATAAGVPREASGASQASEIDTMPVRHGPRRRRWPLVIGSLVVAAGAAVLAFALVAGSGAQRAAAAPTAPAPAPVPVPVQTAATPTPTLTPTPTPTSEPVHVLEPVKPERHVARPARSASHPIARPAAGSGSGSSAPCNPFDDQHGKKCEGSRAP